MSKIHLVATRIVNRMGVATTVHKRDAPVATEAASRIPAPAIKAKKNAKPSTPLTAPEPVDTKRVPYFSEYLNNSIVSSRKKLKDNEIELLHRIIDDGTVSEKALSLLTGYMGWFSPGETIPHYDYNMLLLAERYCKAEPSGSDLIEEHHSIFNSAVRGLVYARREADRKPLKPITSEEELDAHVAVLRFVMKHNQPKDEYGYTQEDKSVRTANGKEEGMRVIDNHSLTALLRAQPGQYTKIVDYISERGMPKNKADVESIREYLSSDESDTVLSEGWL